MLLHNSLFFAASPLEQFEVTNFISLNIFGFNLALTNLGFYVILMVIVLVGLHVLSVNSPTLHGGISIVPSR